MTFSEKNDKIKAKSDNNKHLSDNLSKGGVNLRKYWVLVGNFGSGKSELALNMAVNFAGQGSCTLVDLDVVNPYFRTSERGDVLDKAGVELISPPYALKKIEIMSISPRVYAAFAPGEGNVIFDVGGDNIGAVALGQYKGHFDAVPPEELNVLLVVNPMRPLAADATLTKSLMRKIEAVSRLSVTGLVNNSNLAGQTGLEHLLRGYEVVRELSQMTGVPVWGTCAEAELLAEFERHAEENGLEREYIGRAYPIEIMMHRSWDKFLKEGL